MALARQAHTGDGIGSGLYSCPQQGMTEIAAIGVMEGFRGRGVASQLTALLAQDALQRDCQPFLMAATEREALIYRRVGFVHSGTMLHISRPD